MNIICEFSKELYKSEDCTGIAEYEVLCKDGIHKLCYGCWIDEGTNMAIPLTDESKVEA
jgi:hypothetical protein